MPQLHSLIVSYSKRRATSVWKTHLFDRALVATVFGVPELSASKPVLLRSKCSL